MKSTYQQECYPQWPLSRATPGDGAAITKIRQTNQATGVSVASHRAGRIRQYARRTD